MEVLEPVHREIVPVRAGKRVIELAFESRGECRALIAAIELAAGRLPDDGGDTDALAAGEPEPEPAHDDVGDEAVPAGAAAEPRRRHPHGADYEIPDLGARLNRLTGDDMNLMLRYITALCPDSVEDALTKRELHILPERELCTLHGGSDDERLGAGCESCADELAVMTRIDLDDDGPLPEHLIAASRQIADERAAAAGGPAPYCVREGEGTRCGAAGSTWACGAQRGHGGPVHLAYAADGTVLHTWPAGAPPSLAELRASRRAPAAAPRPPAGAAVRRLHPKGA